MTNKHRRRVVFQPATYQAMQRGINQMVGVLRPTLGPRPRFVANQGVTKNKVELLDSGGVILRRIIELPDRDEDVGAMFLRQMLWQLHEKVGDGTVTAAVIFQTIYNEGVRYVTAGGNAALLRRYLEQGMILVLDALSGMTLPVEGKAQLAQIAQSICYDPPLAAMLGEIFDIIGEYGRLELRAGRSRELVREYVEGMYWERGLVSREMITDRQRHRAEFENAAILISDMSIEEPQDVVPALLMAYQARARGLLIVAGKLSDTVIGFLLANSAPDKMRIMAVKTPGYGVDQAHALQDLAVLTGGRPLLKATGDSLRAVKVEDLGQARRVWANADHFGIVGGKGDARALRRHIADLRALYRQTETGEDRKKLQQRIGKLMGGSATLWVGGSTETEVNLRKEAAQRTADALRGALMEGVLPGGGASLLACRPVLQQKLKASADEDERAAYRILIKAMEAPTRTLIANAGFDPSDIMAEIRLAGPGYGFDVARERVANLTEAGVFDVATVLKAAVHSAIASAALALTVDVVVHRRKREASLKP